MTKRYTFYALLFTGILSLPAAEFILVDDKFDNGDPASNDSGGYVLRGASSMQVAEEEGVLKLGPVSNWGWAAYELHSGIDFAAPDENGSYIIEWLLGPMSVEAHNSDSAPSWGDLRHELSIVTANLPQGERVELWPLIEKGLIAAQLTLKEEDPTAPTQLANFGVFVKDNTSAGNQNGTWIMGQTDIDVSTPTKITMVLTRTEFSLSIDDALVGTRLLSDPGAAFDLSFEEGEEFANGFFVSTRNQMTNQATGTMSIESFKVTQITETSPFAWPGGALFDSDLSILGPNWEMSGWLQTGVTQTVPMMVGNSTSPTAGSNNGLIGDSNRNNGDPAFWYDPDTNTALSETPTTENNLFDTPIDPVVPPSVLSELHEDVTGQWIQSLGSDERMGSMKLRFDNLPTHTGIDLNFILAAFDSIDGGDWFGNTGGQQDPDPDGNGYNFRIKVDGTTVYEARFSTGGILPGGAPIGVEEIGTGLNYSKNYSEFWGPDNTGQTPTGVDDRYNVNWVTDSLYNFEGYFDAGGENPIAHSSDTLEITFEHGLDGGYTSGFIDEGFAIDGVSIELIGYVEANGPVLEITDLERTESGINITWSDPVTDAGTYFVERSSDLETWVELSDGETGPQFFDASVAGEAKAFYRVVRE